MSLLERLNRRFARLATDAVVRRPWLWRLVRRPLALGFDRLAPVWDDVIRGDHLAPLEAALDGVRAAPRRVLDLGTGTGAAAFAAARRWPEAEVTGADVAERMVREARKKVPAGQAGRVRFLLADAAALPFADARFDLVTHVNAIPFFDELARVVAPGGATVFAFSGGAATPIYVPAKRLRAELETRGFSEFREFATGRGTSLLAVKGEAS